MKIFLVPTDFSDCARAAQDTGLDIAIKANVEIKELYNEIKLQIGYVRSEILAKGFNQLWND